MLALLILRPALTDSCFQPGRILKDCRWIADGHEERTCDRDHQYTPSSIVLYKLTPYNCTLAGWCLLRELYVYA